jgi:hypothetical protein
VAHGNRRYRGRTSDVDRREAGGDIEATQPVTHSGPNSYMLSAMDHTLTALERAFQMARSGVCTSVPDLRQRLKAEGYGTTQITGRTLSRQLEALIKAARETHS